MTEVYGSFKRGFKGASMGIEVEGKLSSHDWERLKAELAPILKKYGIKFSHLKITKQKAGPARKAKKKHA